MNDIRQFMLNPNVHGLLAALAQIAVFFPSPYTAIFQGIALALTGTTVVLPEKSK